MRGPRRLGGVQSRGRAGQWGRELEENVLIGDCAKGPGAGPGDSPNGGSQTFRFHRHLRYQQANTTPQFLPPPWLSPPPSPPGGGARGQG